ncbi:hypothetical protein M8J77_025351 [Diaphorina citri]|nr:hypothetical protein M8J77_025351 [Diaphorina citri]
MPQRKAPFTSGSFAERIYWINTKMSQKVAAIDRKASFKNAGKSFDEMRRKRCEMNVELRKAHKDDQLFKRRNIDQLDEIEEENVTVIEPTCMSPIKMTVPEMIEGMKSSNPKMRMIATRSARKMLSKERHPPIDELIEAGVVPICVELLDDENPNTQFEATWALTNIASGTSEQTMTVINANAIPKFLQLLSSPHLNLAEQATWALGNIAGDGARARDLLLGLGTMPQILALVQPNTPTTFLRNIVWAISNLCRNKNPAPDFEKIKICLPLLNQLIHTTDVETLSDICWALSYISDGHNDKIQAVVDTGVVPRLVELLDSEETTILTAALRTVGNIATGNDHQTDCVIQAGGLQKMKKLLSSSRVNIVKEAAWTISNITAGNSRQIDHVIQEGLLPYIVNILENGDAKVQKEAAWIITNFTTSATKEQVSMLINHGVMVPFCNLLSSFDVKTIQVVLEGLDNLLEIALQVGELNQMALLVEESGGLEKLEALQHHENETVYQKCYKIISMAFNDSAENSIENGDTIEFNPQPVNTVNGFNF